MDAAGVVPAGYFLFAATAHFLPPGSQDQTWFGSLRETGGSTPQHRRGRACTQRPRWTRSRKLLRIVGRRQNTTATAQRGRRFSPGIIRRGQLNLGAVITASIDHRRGSLQQRLRRILIGQPKHVTSRILTSICTETGRQRTQRGHNVLTNSSHRTARSEHHIRVDRQRSHARNFALWRAVSPFTESSLGSSDFSVARATRTRRAAAPDGRYDLADSNSISSISKRRAEPRELAANFSTVVVLVNSIHHRPTESVFTAASSNTVALNAVRCPRGAV